MLRVSAFREQQPHQRHVCRACAARTNGVWPVKSTQAERTERHHEPPLGGNSLTRALTPTPFAISASMSSQHRTALDAVPTCGRRDRGCGCRPPTTAASGPTESAAFGSAPCASSNRGHRRGLLVTAITRGLMPFASCALTSAPASSRRRAASSRPSRRRERQCRHPTGRRRLFSCGGTPPRTMPTPCEPPPAPGGRTARLRAARVFMSTVAPRANSDTSAGAIFSNRPHQGGVPHLWLPYSPVHRHRAAREPHRYCWTARRPSEQCRADIGAVGVTFGNDKPADHRGVAQSAAR